MFEEAARQWAGLQPAEGHLRIAINLSTRDLLDTEFPQRLEALMHRHGVAASAFCLEITESAIMDDPQRAEATLNKLAEQGFKLSIDDFGTGYSSLAYLKRLPVHELKIDKSFFMAMESDASDAKIVRSTIDLAHNLNLSVVAEGGGRPSSIGWSPSDAMRRKTISSASRCGRRPVFEFSTDGLGAMRQARPLHRPASPAGARLRQAPGG